MSFFAFLPEHFGLPPVVLGDYLTENRYSAHLGVSLVLLKYLLLKKPHFFWLPNLFRCVSTPPTGICGVKAAFVLHDYVFEGGFAGLADHDIPTKLTF